MTNDCKTCPVSTGTHKPAEAVHVQIDEPQDEAMRLADECDESATHWVHEIDTRFKAAKMLRAQHARIEDLEAQHREELRAYEITVANREARIAELESQLEAIGAGGVEPLRKPAAPQAVQAAVPEAIEQMAVDRYKVVPSHESMFHRWAVVADNGAQQLYIGREGECQNMARKFMGAFLDGAFVAMQNATPAHPAEGVPASVIAGAVFDFAGYLTTLPHKEAIHCSEAHEAAPMVEAITEWCKRRNLTTDGAKVETWRDHLAEAPAHPAEGVPAQCPNINEPRGCWRVACQLGGKCREPERSATQPAAQGLAALTPAARDVLAERKRQIETEGWKPERDDVYDTGEMALAAACYAAHSASCAAIKAPHTARGVFVRTRSAQDFVGEMWPWSADWWKPSGHRRNLEKAAALILAEIERIDRAAQAAKQGEQQ
ncbi:hypothetical protein [Comamonas aquatica]|uniref:Uncharacterized protein n=1 Tax=Comamonas aquatica TaxID=225991 RepID=A0AA42HRY4_9BURK|nr:hypothetical protein [Comamonas aquatica]MDH0363430.1 hypothetical protein [Comamonas aquatica]